MFPATTPPTTTLCWKSLPSLSTLMPATSGKKRAAT